MNEMLGVLGQKLAGFLGERIQTGSSSPTLQAHEDYLRSFGLDTLLPYRAFDPRTKIFHNEASVGFVLETHPLVGCTEDMQREISGIFQHTLKEGSCLQFMLYGDPRIDSLLEKWSRPLRTKGGIYKDLAERRVAYLESLGRLEQEGQKDLTPRTFRCLISYSEKGTCLGPVEEGALLTLREQVMGALKTLGAPVHICDAQDLIIFLDGLINFDHSSQSSRLKWCPRESLAQQIPQATSQWQIDSEGIHMRQGKYTVRTYGVLREPDYWSLYAMGELLGDSYRDAMRLTVPFFLHYGLSVCDQGKTHMLVQAKEDWVEKQSFSKIGKRIPRIKDQAKELAFVRGQLSQGARFIQSRFSVTLLSPQALMTEQEHILKSLFRSNRWEIQAERYLQLPLYLSTLPMMWGEGMKEDLGTHKRLKTTLTSEAANLLPLQGEWKGNSDTGMTFIGRRGQIFTWSPFASSGGNYNVSVVGRSGSGKSVFMQELVTTALGAGAQVFIIDVGRSFERLVKLLGGSYVEFTPQASLCLNPFSNLPDQEGALQQEALAMLKPLVSLMAAPTEGTSDLENALIEEALIKAWQKKNRQAGMDDVVTALQETSNRLAHALGKKLFPYTRQGSYGRYFNGPATLDLSAPMVVIELEELKERKDLQSVIVQVMILHITNQLYLGNRSRATYLVLDEAWDLLRAPQAGVFIETAARRFRKYRGSLVVGTQSIHDFYATPGAQAAFDNSDWLCMLSQKKESIEQLKKSERIVVDPPMEALLHSLKTKAGSYAEVMIRGPHGYALGRLVLDPFSNMLYTTKAEEFTAIQQRMAEGATLYDALKGCSDKSSLPRAP